MKRYAPLLVVLILVGSVAWLTLNTQVEAPLPWGDEPVRTAAPPTETAPIGIHAQPFVAVEADVECSFAGTLTGGHAEVVLRAVELDSRMQPYSVAANVAVAASGRFNAVVRGKTCMVILTATDEDGCEAGLLIDPRHSTDHILHLERAELADLLSVHDSAGRALHGAEIRRGLLDPVLHTDAGGFARVPRTHAALQVSAAGFATVRVTTGGVHLPQEFSLTLQRTTPMSLTLRDEHGEPLAAARVRVVETGLTLRSDTKGTLLLDALPEDRSGLTLEISAGDSHGGFFPLPLGNNASITVPQPPRVEGVVCNTLDQPLAGGRVRCFEQEYGSVLAQTRTGGDGRFRLPSTQSGPVVLVVDDKRSLVVQEAQLPLREPLNLKLDSNAACSITTLDEAGAILDGVRVRLLFNALLLQEVVSDSTGHCSLPSATGCVLNVSHSNTLAHLHPTVPAGALTLRMKARPCVSLHVVAAEDETALLQISVVLQTAEAERVALWPEPGRTFESKDGHYSLRSTDFDNGERCTLLVGAPGRTEQTCTWWAESKTLEVKLAAAGPIIGRVRSSLGAVALEGVAVSSRAGGSCRTDRYGKFTLPRMPLGEAVLRFEAEGCVPLELRAPATEAGTTRDIGDVALDPAADVSIVVATWRDGMEATVHFTRDDAPTQRIELRGAGPWIARSLRTGRWNAVISSSEPTLDGQRKIVDITQSHLGTLDFTARATTATLLGTVLIPDGSASVRGVAVRLRDSKGALVAQAACDRDGDFQIDKLTPGMLTLEALVESAQGALRGQITIDLVAGESSVILRLLRQGP